MTTKAELELEFDYKLDFFMDRVEEMLSANPRTKGLKGNATTRWAIEAREEEKRRRQEMEYL